MLVVFLTFGREGDRGIEELEVGGLYECSPLAYLPPVLKTWVARDPPPVTCRDAVLPDRKVGWKLTTDAVEESRREGKIILVALDIAPPNVCRFPRISFDRRIPGHFSHVHCLERVERPLEEQAPRGDGREVGGSERHVGETLGEHPLREDVVEGVGRESTHHPDKFSNRDVSLSASQTIGKAGEDTLGVEARHTGVREKLTHGVVLASSDEPRHLIARPLTHVLQREVRALSRELSRSVRRVKREDLIEVGSVPVLEERGEVRQVEEPDVLGARNWNVPLGHMLHVHEHVMARTGGRLGHGAPLPWRKRHDFCRAYDSAIPYANAHSAPPWLAYRLPTTACLYGERSAVCGQRVVKDRLYLQRTAAVRKSQRICRGFGRHFDLRHLSANSCELADSIMLFFFISISWYTIFSMPKVFITRPIPDEGLKMLEAKGYELSIYPKDEIIPRDEFLRSVKGVDALLSILTDTVDGEVLDAAGPQLRVIANYAVGFDNIDLTAAKQRNVLVTNAPGPEIVQSVAEHAFTLMLALARRIVESDTFARAGKYRGWGPQLLLGTDVYSKTLGIVGLGRIGFAVADRAVKGFGMKTIYHDVKQNPDFEKQYGGRFASLEELLKEADFVSLHVPLLPATRHLMNRERFAMMKPTAFLVNTARGPVVDEKALLEALQNKKIAGAALDVFECEPSIDCDLSDHLELKAFDNVILTPHTASATVETRQAMSRTAAMNIIEVLEGRTPPNLVK